MAERETTLGKPSITDQGTYWKEKVAKHDTSLYDLRGRVGPISLLRKAFHFKERRYARRNIQLHEQEIQRRREHFRRIKRSPEVQIFLGEVLGNATKNGRDDLVTAMLQMRNRTVYQMQEEYKTDEWVEKYPELARMVEQITVVMTSEFAAWQEQVDLTPVSRADLSSVSDDQPKPSKNVLRSHINAVGDALSLLGLDEAVKPLLDPKLGNAFRFNRILEFSLHDQGVNLEFGFSKARKKGIVDGVNTSPVPARVTLKISKL